MSQRKTVSRHERALSQQWSPSSVSRLSEAWKDSQAALSASPTLVTAPSQSSAPLPTLRVAQPAVTATLASSPGAALAAARRHPTCRLRYGRPGGTGALCTAGPDASASLLLTAARLGSTPVSARLLAPRAGREAGGFWRLQGPACIRQCIRRRTPPNAIYKRWWRASTCCVRGPTQTLRTRPAGRIVGMIPLDPPALKLTSPSA